MLNWILSINPDYATTLELIGAVGGKTLVRTGHIDLDMCSAPYTNLKINFADLCGNAALIGIDLLNN